jgi:hypothetical protein
MAQPLHSGKQAVDLAAAGPRVSKIRRDPPAAVKEIEFRDRAESDRSDVLVGILAFALAICALAVAFGAYSGWSPAEYTIEVTEIE